jgi:hypothetical protein
MSRPAVDWNLLDPRELKRQNREEKKEAEMKRKSSTSETKETTKKTSDSDDVNPGVSSNGKKMGRPVLTWEKRAENAGAAKLLAELNEKIAEKRLESKKRQECH